MIMSAARQELRLVNEGDYTIWSERLSGNLTNTEPAIGFHFPYLEGKSGNMA